MPLPVTLQCDDGHIAKVNREGVQVVAVRPDRAEDLSIEQVQRRQLYSQPFQTTAGSGDLNVDGSSTAVEFQVTAENGVDSIIYVTHIRMFLEGSNFKIDSNEIRRFGAAATAPGLANGIKLTIQQQTRTTEAFNSAGVRNVGDFYRYGGGGALSMADSMLNVVDGVSSGVDILNVEIYPSVPIALYPGTQDRIYFTIRDDLTAISSITATAYGYQDLLK